MGKPGDREIGSETNPYFPPSEPSEEFLSPPRRSRWKSDLLVAAVLSLGTFVAMIVFGIVFAILLGPILER